MITQWTLSNFKSIVKETPLPFAPLTIFAGPNSSGKSTILQSLLLVSQTLASKVNSRSVVLNGALARLGQFDDLKSHNNESTQISLAWTCQPTQGIYPAINEVPTFPDARIVYGRRMDSLKEISCKLSFDAYPGSAENDLFQLQPQLFLFSMSVWVRAGDKADRRYELTVSRKQAGNTKSTKMADEDADDEWKTTSMPYDIVLDDNSLAEIRNKFTTAESVDCALRHFLPDTIFIRVNIITELANELRMLLINGVPPFYRRMPFLDRKLVIPYGMLMKLQEKFGNRFDPVFEIQNNLSVANSGLPIKEWNERMRRLPLEKRFELSDELAGYSDLPRIITEALQSERKAEESEFKVLGLRPPSYLNNASSYLGKMFTDRVKYLGPLRDDPKPLYPLATHAGPSDIGLRGENTAAVLNLHKERLIRFIPSSAFTGKTFDQTPTVRSLEAAVTDWLQYLGVAETAQSVDKGKLGHELKATIAENEPPQDLTHVGVGVSQVLPILVMSLLAEPDTTLIFEQPELHLHPKVQTRLGDFFLSIVLMGRQCLIETHSEYLINRLRYRAAAEGDGNRVIDKLKIYFVEKEAGESHFREVKVNEYGAILDWPDGFFDQSQSEAESILRAAVTKRKARKGN